MQENSQLLRSSVANTKAEAYAVRYPVFDRNRSMPPTHYVDRQGRPNSTIDFSFFPYPSITPENGSNMLSQSVVHRQLPVRPDIRAYPMQVAATSTPAIIDNEDFSSLTREQLAAQLRYERLEKAELRRLVSVLREGGDSQLQSMAHRLEEATKELVALREQNYRLKNIANDELVMLEKVETKEIYGKKTKVQEELEAARGLKEDYEKLLQTFKTRESVFRTLEDEAHHLREYHTKTEPRFAELLREYNGMKAVLDKLRSENAGLKQTTRIVVDHRQTRELESRINELQQENSHLVADLSRKEELENLIDKLRKELQAEHSARMDEEKQRNAEYQREMGRLFSEIDRLRQIEQNSFNLAEKNKAVSSKLADALNEIAFIKTELQKEREENNQQRENQKKFSELNDEYNHVININKGLEAAKERLKKQVLAYQEELESADTIKKELGILKPAHAALSTEAATLKAEKRFLESITLPELQSQLGNLRQEVQALRQAHDRASEAQRRAAQLEVELHAQTQKAQTAVNQMAELQRDIGALKSEAQRNFSKLARLAELEGRNSALNNELISANNSLKRADDELAQLGQECAAHEAECQRLAGIEQKLNAVENEYSSFQKEYMKKESARNQDLESALTTRDRENEALNNRLQTLQAELAQLRDESDRLRRKRGELEERLSILQSQMQEESLQSTRLRGELDRLIGVDRINSEINREVARLQELKSHMEFEFQRLRGEIEILRPVAQRTAEAESGYREAQIEIKSLRDGLATAVEAEAQLKTAAQRHDEFDAERLQIEVCLVALNDEVMEIDEWVAHGIGEKFCAGDRVSPRSEERQFFGGKVKDYQKAERYLHTLVVQSIQKLEKHLGVLGTKYTSALLKSKEDLRKDLKKMLLSMGKMHLYMDLDQLSESEARSDQARGIIDELREDKRRLLDIIRHLVEFFGLAPIEVDKLIGELQRAVTLHAAINVISSWDLHSRIPNRSSYFERCPSRDEEPSSGVSQKQEQSRSDATIKEHLLQEIQKLTKEVERLKLKIKDMKEKPRNPTQSEVVIVEHIEREKAANASISLELQRLREENAILVTKLEAHRSDIRLKKKVLLNELVNFVNSKNNFENSCYSELTRYSLNS